jgi:hypothetical protein
MKKRVPRVPRINLVLGLFVSLLVGVFLLLSVQAQVATSQTVDPSGLGMQQPPGMGLIVPKSVAAPMLPSFSTGQIPPTIPKTLVSADPTGQITTYQPGGAIATNSNAFFISSGITNNGRTCFTCHQPQNDWEISPPEIMSEYLATKGTSVLFHPIDAAVCPNSELLFAKYPDPLFILARSQLFTRGNFRIALNAPNPLGPPLPNASHITFDGSQPQWVLKVLYDPYGCETDPTYGLPANQLSVYRRPLNATNVTFLVQDPGFYTDTAVASAFPISPEERQEIMWDARERDLATQFVDATEFHGQTNIAPDSTYIAQGILFQSGTFTAQTYNNVAKDLTGSDGSGATGGPLNLYASAVSRIASTATDLFGEPIACFDYTSSLPAGPLVPGVTRTGDVGQFVCPGDPALTVPVTQLFTAFATPNSGGAVENAMRESIARGEAIFTGKTVTFAINDVPGFNDVVGHEPAGGSCSACHNNLSAVNDAFGDPKRLGIMDNSNHTSDGGVVNVMPITLDFPQFAFYCPTGTITYFSNPVTSMNCPGSTPGHPATCDEFDTTDAGKGLITGKCADLGKMKVPILRGVGARAPYFHGGNALTLFDVVNFYNTRFNIGLTAQQKTDLVNYLSSL